MKKLFLLMVFLAVSIQSDAAKMSSYANNTTPNSDVYFIGVDPNDLSQTANGSNYRYSLNSILNLGLLDAVFNSLSIAGTGDSWIELENNTSFSDSIAGKYGLRFYNGALQQIINGTSSDIGSASVIQRSSDPVYTDLSTGQIAVSTSSGDLFIKTSTGMYTFAGSYAADPTPPLLTAVSIAADGVTVTKTFSEAVSQGAGYSDTHFNLDASVTGNDIGETYVSGSGTNSLTFTAASTIMQGETVNLDFSGVANSVEDEDGTDLAAVTDYAVTNASTQTAGPDYIINEDFTGTGTPSGWTIFREESQGTVDPDYSNISVFAGADALNLISITYRQVYLQTPTITTSNNISMSFRLHIGTVPTAATNVLEMLNASTVVSKLGIPTDTTALAIYHGTKVSSSSTGLIATGTDYYVWVDYTINGTSGQMAVYVAQTDAKPETASATITNGDSTSAITGLRLKADNSANIYFTDVKLWDN